MRKIVLAGWMLLLVLAAAPQVRADFALSDQDRVAFFGNKVLAVPDMPRGVETFLRIRYPELKTRFRTYGRHEAAIMKNAVKRFEAEVVPAKPTVVVLCFGTDDVPQRPYDEARFNQFKADFDNLVDLAKRTGARLYVMTPLFPEIAKSPQLQKVEYDVIIGKYAAAMQAAAQEKGATVIDWFDASRRYSVDHADKKRLAITTAGTYPSTLGFAIGMASILEAWGAEPCGITVTADWNSESVSASLGQAAVTKVGDDKILLKLSDMPIPWVVPRRGTVTGGDWPGTTYYNFMLTVANVPDGGIMISEPGGKNALPYLSMQLREGTDLGFVGPLTKLDAVKNLAKWLTAKFDADRRHVDFMRKPIPEPEYQQAYKTYYLGLEQYADATDRIVQRQPRVMDLTLEIYKAPLPPGGVPDQERQWPGPRPGKKVTPKETTKLPKPAKKQKSDDNP